MGRNAKQLVEAGRRAGVEIGLFFARKANKALSLVDEIVRLGHGVDVAGQAGCSRRCNAASQVGGSF